MVCVVYDVEWLFDLLDSSYDVASVRALMRNVQVGAVAVQFHDWAADWAGEAVRRPAHADPPTHPFREPSADPTLSPRFSLLALVAPYRPRPPLKIAEGGAEGFYRDDGTRDIVCSCFFCALVISAVRPWSPRSVWVTYRDAAIAIARSQLQAQDQDHTLETPRLTLREPPRHGP